MEPSTEAGRSCRDGEEVTGGGPGGCSWGCTSLLAWLTLATPQNSPEHVQRGSVSCNSECEVQKCCVGVELGGFSHSCCQGEAAGVLKQGMDFGTCRVRDWRQAVTQMSAFLAGVTQMSALLAAVTQMSAFLAAHSSHCSPRCFLEQSVNISWEVFGGSAGTHSVGSPSDALPKYKSGGSSCQL